MGEAIDLRDKSSTATFKNTCNSNYILNADAYSTDKCSSHPSSKCSFLKFVFAAYRITESQSGQNAEIKTDHGLPIPYEFICNTILTYYNEGTLEGIE